MAKPAKLDVETKAELKKLREVERRYQILKAERELLKKVIRFACDRKRKFFEFIDANRTEQKVALMCRRYGVTRAGYYGWRERPVIKRAKRNAKLAERIQAVHRMSRGLYGSPRIYQALRQQGCTASENRVARVMRSNGIKARVALIRYTSPSLKRYFAVVRNEQLNVDLQRPDQVWVGDITYLESEIFHGYRFDEDRDMRAALLRYPPFYNRARLHSSLHYVSPATYEKQWQGNPVSIESGEDSGPKAARPSTLR